MSPAGILGGSPPDAVAARLAAAFAHTPAARHAWSRMEQEGICPIHGVPAVAASFFVAALRRHRPHQPMVMVLDGLRAMETALQDLQTWLGHSSEAAQVVSFPDWEILPHESKLPQLDVISDRLAALVALDRASRVSGSEPPLVVTSVTALGQATFAPPAFLSRLRLVRRGESYEPLDLVEWLEDQGYEPEAQVTQKGTLALRGGILDVWPPPAAWPVRLEFFGSEVDSLREFDPVTQLSRGTVADVPLTPAGELGLLKAALREDPGSPVIGHLLDYLPAGSLLLLIDPASLRERAEEHRRQVPSGDPFHVAWDDLGSATQSRGHRIVELIPPWEGHSTPPVTTLPGRSEVDDGTSPPSSSRDPHADVDADAGAGRTLGVRGPRRPNASQGDGIPADAGPLPDLGLQSLEVLRPLDTRRPDPAVVEAQRREFLHQLHRWIRSGLSVHLFCNNEGERQRFYEIWAEHGLDRIAEGLKPDSTGEGMASGDAVGSELKPGLHAHLGAMGRGFLCPEAGFVVVTDAEVFGRYKILRPRRLKSAHAQQSRSLLDIDFTEFDEGDFVVHVEHGIGRFVGLQAMPSTPGHRGVAGAPGAECLVIEYAAGNPADPPPRLYVPVSEAHLVSKYVGAGKARPPLNTLGGTRWAKARKDAERAVADLAAELLAVQAARETQPGHAFAPDNAWQREFEAAFVYEETPDQVRAIDATKKDMERPRPMDRLICGDVGFGKTEVALRAAFKAVMGGFQVAVLVPTTVLAQQHHATFSERMSDYPVRVDLLSRFRTRREQRAVLERLQAGATDIVIGTHRLVQRDVQFHRLGLVIIDEEQRFGVLHKERLKLLRQTVDVLTLSATPIPRTLYLALSGARDMSTIETPPQDRLPIETIVAAYDERLIRDAIQRELNRQGQVFFLHNRVATIHTVAEKLRALVPQARLVVGHGQMDPDELEEVMTRFVGGEADVLLSTTIVESGLDIPNANTIIIDRADRFGLSELYQLRGRVGRYKHQAFAYLLIPRHAQLLSEARKRIAAIRQYSTLGSGFKIAMRDLEIRGAGNLLGPQQSGHITAVGFDLYCQLLKQSIGVLKGERVARRVEVQVRLDFLPMHPADEGEPRGTPGAPPRGVPAGDRRSEPISPPPAAPASRRSRAGLPISYIPEAKLRLEIHRRLAQVTTPGELRALKNDLRDRFGPPPVEVELLLLVAELRIFAAALDVSAIEVRDDRLMLTRRGQWVQVGGRFPRLSKRDPKARLAEIRRFLGSLHA